MGYSVRQTGQGRAATRKEDVIDFIVWCAGEEELQRPADFLRHGFNERTQNSGLVILRQISRALLGFSFVGRKPILTHDQLCQLRAAKGLIALIQHIFVAHDLHARGQGAHFKQGHE